MHDLAAVDDIISAIGAEIKKVKGPARIKKINIRIGELEHIDPGHFESHFKERARGTYLESAALEFKKVNAEFRCSSCSEIYTPSEGMDGCPECGNKSSEIIKGNGIYVESLELM